MYVGPMSAGPHFSLIYVGGFGAGPALERSLGGGGGGGGVYIHIFVFCHTNLF